MENTLSTRPRHYTAQSARLSLRHVPNALTVGRILAAPVFGVLLLHGGGTADWRTGIVFALAALTDQIDGCLARRWQAESRFGALADPLADKLIIGTALVALVHLDRISGWTLLVLVVRQAVLWGARAHARGRYGFPVSSLARVSAWVLYAALGMIIVTRPTVAWPPLLLWVGVALALAEVVPYGNVIRRNTRATGDRVALDVVKDQATTGRGRRWTKG